MLKTLFSKQYQLLHKTRHNQQWNAILLYELGQFGGFVRFGKTQYPITGCTYQQRCEIESYWLSLCLTPQQILFPFLAWSPHRRTPDFVAAWLKTGRQSLVEANEGQRRLMGSFLGKRFEAWQCLRGWLTMEQIDSRLEDMTPDEIQAFFSDLHHARAIAGGWDEWGQMSELMRQRLPAARDPKAPPPPEIDTVEAMLAHMVQELDWPPEAILKLTPAAMRQWLTKPSNMDDKLEIEKIVPADDVEGKRFQKRYIKEAKALLGIE